MKYIFVKQQFYMLILLFIAGTFNADAQPSGGPYGPVQKTYDIPRVEGRIYYVSPDGRDENPGEIPERPTTIEMAVKKAVTGDAVILRGGIYRTGNLILNQGITFQPYAGEHPVLKGTYVATDWKKLGNGLWVTAWPHLFPSGPESWWKREREEKRTPLYRFNDDMVFIDGTFLQTVGSEEEVDTNTFYIDYANRLVYIGTDPADRMVEITAFNVAIHRIMGVCHGKISDGKGPVIRGLEITQYADTAILIEGTYPEGLSDEKKHGKDVTGTVLENCILSYCSRIAAYLIGDSLVIRNCKVSNTSTEGIYIVSSSDVLLEKNIFTANNIENITGFYPAAVKIFNQCYRVTCRDNLVIDLPNSNGIWYDVGNVDGVFINNWVENVGNVYSDFYLGREYWSGFFFEISKSALCAGNVFVNCDNGIRVLNSSDVEIYQNTLLNSRIVILRNERNAVGDHFGWHPSTGPDIDERDGHVLINNLITASDKFIGPLLQVMQSDSLCGRMNQPQLKKMDHNVYVRQSENDTIPLIFWSPLLGDTCSRWLQSPGELHAINPDFAANSRYFKAYKGPLFNDAGNKDFRLLKKFPEYRHASQLPPVIKELLGYQKEYEPFIGAYSPIP